MKRQLPRNETTKLLLALGRSSIRASYRASTAGRRPPYRDLLPDIACQLEIQSSLATRHILLARMNRRARRYQPPLNAKPDQDCEILFYHYCTRCTHLTHCKIR